jgi:light-regulated signal transduction histidine kinase (bacteriophytochrome)
VNAIVSNLRDITARKEAQDELLLLNQSLEKKVEERTMQLAESNKALESFSSMAAHDLQAPLRVLSGYTSMVKHDYAENLGEEGAALLDVIMKQTKHMTQLVSDLLTFSRASHTIMKEEKVDLDAMVHELSDELCLINSTRKTPEIKIGDLGSTSCDAHLIRQVWSNLISNALKYSGKRDKPQIEIGRMPGEEEVIYYVKDNGAGFDARHQHKLFQVFQRLHTSSDFEGTGVGLALVKNVISRHGGRVWAESELDKGATFYFSMPA